MAGVGMNGKRSLKVEDKGYGSYSGCCVKGVKQ
jgi:hypothetical protein